MLPRDLGVAGLGAASASPRTKRRVWTAVGLLVALLVVGIALVNPTADVRQLPDGTFVSLAKVTFGKAHRMRLGNRWQDHLGVLLPDALATRLGSHYEKIASTRDRWLFWVSWTRPMNESYHEAALYDDHGCCLGWAGRCNSTMYRGASPWFEGFAFTPAPPSTRTAEVRLFPLQYERDREGRYLKPELARFTVANPAGRSRTERPADSFPVTHRLGEIQFTLLELWTGVSRPSGSIRAPEIYRDEGSKARVAIARGNQPARDWSPLGILEVRDENGNEVEGYYQAWNSSGDSPEYLLQGPPLCSEAVYRVRVGFEQTGGLPNDRVREARLPLPAASGTVLTNLELVFPAWKLQVRGLAGTNSPLPGATDADGNHILRGSTYSHALSVDLTPRAAAHPTNPTTGLVQDGESKVRLIEARDDQGREIGNPRTSRWNSAPTSVHYALEVPPGAKEMVLRFAEVRPVIAEYRVKPRRFKTESSSP